jgi:hypothetical protein
MLFPIENKKVKEERKILYFYMSGKELLDEVKKDEEM